jgi:hypothetical protein
MSVPALEQYIYYFWVEVVEGDPHFYKRILIHKRYGFYLGKIRYIAAATVLLKIGKREWQKWVFNRKEALFTSCHRSSASSVPGARRREEGITSSSSPCVLFLSSVLHAWRKARRR